MKYLIGLFAFVLIVSCQEKPKLQIGDFAKSNTFQMGTPNYTIDSAFFRKSATINFNFRYPDAIIRYTTNGDEVTASSTVYEKPIVVTNTSGIRAKVFHSDFSTSEEILASATQLKNNISNATMTITPNPSKKYSGKGAQTLTDFKKGTLQITNVDTWLGFNSSEVVVKAQLKTPLTLSKITLSTLTNQGGWIFSPYSISVFSGTEQIGQFSNKDANAQEETAMKTITISINSKKYKALKIVIHNLEKIPDWHAGKGSQPWFFIDELIVE